MATSEYPYYRYKVWPADASDDSHHWRAEKNHPGFNMEANWVTIGEGERNPREYAVADAEKCIERQRIEDDAEWMHP